MQNAKRTAAAANAANVANECRHRSCDSKNDLEPLRSRRANSPFSTMSWPKSQTRPWAVL